MKIYELVHYYDNGLSCADYREYQDNVLFSSEEKAMETFKTLISGEYEGRYAIYERTLDKPLNNKEIITESIYKACCPPEYLIHEFDEPSLEEFDKWFSSQYEQPPVEEEEEQQREKESTVLELLEEMTSLM